MSEIKLNLLDSHNSIIYYELAKDWLFLNSIEEYRVVCKDRLSGPAGGP